MDKLTLDTTVSKVYLVGPASAKCLEKLGIGTVRDLLYHLPNRYDDFSLITKTTAVQEGETVTIQGQVDSIKNQFTNRGFVLQRATVSDDAGTIDVMWFNQRFLTSAIHQGDQISLSGKIRRNGNKLQLESPDYEVIRNVNKVNKEDFFGKEVFLSSLSKQTIHTGRLVPVYPETAGVSSKWLRSRISSLLKAIDANLLPVPETLDEQIIAENNLLDLTTALHQAHFPDSLDLAERAKKRLAFDELLLSHLQSLARKEERAKEKVTNKFQIVEIRDQLKNFMAHLPFTLTSAQKNAVNAIFKDLASQTPMNRLLQGDVGSGKTVVAALAMLAAHLNGFESALMAPTEILAQQHYATINKLLAPLKLKVGIATGSKKDYRGFDLIVGTHALLSDELNFKKLGLVVIDEQHRFGVEQRAKLTGKGVNPHVLTMTATPIPRTVALTLYGDLDLSVLDEMPVGRKSIKTWVVPAAKRDSAYQWLKKQQTQSFIVCPLIDESEAETMQAVKAAKAEYDRLTTILAPQKLGLLHGRMPSKNKDLVLEKFRNGEIDTLVATPVVEVGIDIPAATIMVIEDAQRFGLAQLHQLRGRVGRSDAQSYCLLFTGQDSDATRLKYLETVHNGMELAEIDLRFRGPGQRYGTQQHGHWDLKIADFSDLGLIEKTNQIAQKVLAEPQAFPTLHHSFSAGKINVVAN